LKTSSNATIGTAASPSAILAIGRPVSTMFEKIPPSPKMDCDTPSILKSPTAAARPTKNTIRQLPK
jgi:hypothetical protein